MNSIKDKKVGFIGTGNLAQSIISGLLESDTLRKDQIFASNRTEKKLERVTEKFQIKGFPTNEELVDHCDVIFIATKPQDFFDAIEPIAMSFSSEKVVISLAAGIRMETLKKTLPEATQIIRMMLNIPIRVGKAVIGYSLNEDSGQMDHLVQNLMSSLGLVIKANDDDMLSAVTVSAASGTGFVIEFMTYWVDWIVDYGFSEDDAKKIAVETFLGASALSKESNLNLHELLDQVTSKKGVTHAGLDSIRELEIERALRISFEKALLRDKELGR